MGQSHPGKRWVKMDVKSVPPQDLWATAYKVPQLSMALGSVWVGFGSKGHPICIWGQQKWGEWTWELVLPDGDEKVMYDLSRKCRYWVTLEWGRKIVWEQVASLMLGMKSENLGQKYRSWGILRVARLSPHEFLRRKRGMQQRPLTPVIWEDCKFPNGFVYVWWGRGGSGEGKGHYIWSHPQIDFMSFIQTLWPEG